MREMGENFEGIENSHQLEESTKGNPRTSDSGGEKE